ncbi:minor extracellular serine protease Vpr [Croceifilum oryzae]|uniref:Minor extracellular serine protease Vpr n=1 Tax=Croceifilum oryzae TaxID=1553429 RepID=A0AAJ1WRD1_9BACL|nr:S8 family serine peptidase [Croceifilum oryzae]MDQ0416198.1 minor extracellular serine protease Vpr [Croceifilum oryzae]
MRKTGTIVLSTLLAVSVSSLGWLSPNAQAATSTKLPKQMEEKIAKLAKNKVSKYIDTKSSKPVDVIVQMNQQPVGEVVKNSKQLKSSPAKDYQAQMKEALNQAEKKLTKVNSKVKVKQRFDTVFSGFAVSIPANQIHKLASMPEVKAVYPALKYKALSTGGSTVGAPEVWKLKDAQGLPVDGRGIKVAVIDTGIDSKHPDLKNNYIGGYDVVDRDNDPQDEQGHGTHVAGIIAANGDIKGVAPEASILAYRVLGKQGGTTSDILTGIEMAVRDGADVMNLSLGANANYPDDPLVSALNHAAKIGVSVTVANGNSGGDAWTVGVPATADKVISVGASTLEKEFPKFEVVGTGTSFDGAQLTKMKFPSNSQFEIVDVGFGSPLDYKKVNVKGKYVLVQQGAAKQDIYVSNAHKAGATGVLLYVKGQEQEALQNIEASLDNKIPAVQLAAKDAIDLKASLKAGKAIASLKEYKPYEFMAEFSSRGPVHETWAVKPDVVAPGVGIKSTVPGEEKYAEYDGTSMAAPQVAGAAALLRQMHPDWTPEDVKASLSNTAKTLTDITGKSYDVMTQGAGRIDIPKAIQATTLVTPNNFTFGLVKPNSGEAKLEKKLTIKNTSGTSKTYTSRVEMATNTGIQVQAPNQVEVSANGQEDLTVKITVDSSLPRDVYSGYLYLTDGKEEQKVPFTFSIDPASYNRVNYLGVSDLIFSPNGDGKEESTTLSYYVPTVAKHLNFYLRNLDDESKVSLIHQEENVGSGWHGMKWTGNAVDKKAVPEGIYEMQAVASDDEVESATAALVLVDKTAPVITANLNEEASKIDLKIEDFLMQYNYFFKMFGLAQDDLVKVEYILEGTNDRVRVPLNEEKMEIEIKPEWLESGKTSMTILATDDAGNQMKTKVNLKK